MSNKLILFTADFPYGSGETFLETEITYLAKGFDEVLIISSNTLDKQTRNLPDNCSVERIDLQLSQSQKLFSILHIFDPLFWKELKIIRTVYKQKLTKGILATMFISLSRAKKVETYSKQLIENVKPEKKLYFYSYWCDDVAIGFAMIQKQNVGINTFCRVHRWDVYFDQSAVGYLPFRHCIADNIKSIFSISEDALQYMQNVWKVKNKGNLKLSRLGISEQVRIEHTQSSIFTIVSCSNLIPVKRVDLLAKAIMLLDGNFPLRWIHIGDGPERLKIEAIISTVSTTTEIKLMGRMSNTEVFELYKKIEPDIFINVSSSEGVPVSIMEAMSFGIPVIATNVGGNSEIVNEENGSLLPENFKISHLINVVESYKHSPHKRIKAYSTWKVFYNADINYISFVHQINGVILNSIV